MKRFASLIFVFLMFGLPFALAQDAGFEGFEDMAMPEIGAGEAAGIIGLMLGMGVVMLLPLIIIIALMIFFEWKVLQKCGRSGALSLLLLVPFGGLVVLIMNIIDMKKIGRGAGSIVGILFIPIIMLPIIAFSKGGAAAAPLLDDGLELDEAPTSEAMNVANRRMAATDASRTANAGTGAFSGATAFTIFACLGLLIFIGVIVLQTMEILYLDGTMDGNSIWPPKP